MYVLGLGFLYQKTYFRNAKCVFEAKKVIKAKLTSLVIWSNKVRLVVISDVNMGQ